MRKAPYTAVAATAAGSGGNTRRDASRGNLWWQPCSAKWAATAHGCDGIEWKICRAPASCADFKLDVEIDIIVADRLRKLFEANEIAVFEYEWVVATTMRRKLAGCRCQQACT